MIPVIDLKSPLALRQIEEAGFMAALIKFFLVQV